MRAHERRVLVLGVDEQLLALGEVDAGADEQTGEGAQARVDVVGHGRRRDQARVGDVAEELAGRHAAAGLGLQRLGGRPRRGGPAATSVSAPRSTSVSM